MRMIVLVVLSAALPAAYAIADKSLSGEDAAYIDWGVKNCGVISTDKEHFMVEQANAKGRDVFSNQYLRQYQSKSLVEALASPSRQEAMCTDIKAWYGPQGSRILGLINWKREASTEVNAKPSSPPSETRKGRKRSGQ
jgi:hypothetical protein